MDKGSFLDSDKWAELLVNPTSETAELVEAIHEHSQCFSTAFTCKACEYVLESVGKDPLFLSAAHPQLPATSQRKLLIEASSSERSAHKTLAGYQPTKMELVAHGLLSNPNVFQEWSSYDMPDFLSQPAQDLFLAFHYLKDEVLEAARRNATALGALMALLVSSQGAKWKLPNGWEDRGFKLPSDFKFEPNDLTVEASVSLRKQAQVSVMVWMAIGDALGAPHEFRPPLDDDEPLEMLGGGGWEPGEWTDDTAMAVAILKAWNQRGEFGSRESLDALVEIWVDWAKSAKDVGIQTRQVLSCLETPTATEAWSAAEENHKRVGRSAGNGSLMRTAPLAFLEVNDQELTRIVRAVSMLTHFEIDASDACVIWTHAIRRNLSGEDMGDSISWAVQHLSVYRQNLWHSRIHEAREKEPRDFDNNGWVVAAFQAAVSAIAGNEHNPLKAVERAVRAGYDTDTVAAITGAYMGSTLLGSDYPAKWIPLLHGWPNINAQGLAALSSTTVK